MSIEELDGGAIQELLRAETRGIVVDFWSPWCAPCRALRPHLRTMAEEHRERWRFVAVDTEAHPGAASEFEVSALPTLVWFRDGKELTRLAGAVTVSRVAETLEELNALEP